MTALEETILKHGTRWVWQHKAFTTVVNGHAFAVYREGDIMRFAGLTKEATADQLDTHHTEAPAVTAFWVLYHGTYQPRMFDMKASAEFVSRVILDAFPELNNLA